MGGDLTVKFSEILTEAKAWLRREERLTYRSLRLGIVGGATVEQNRHPRAELSAAIDTLFGKTSEGALI